VGLRRRVAQQRIKKCRYKCRYVGEALGDHPGAGHVGEQGHRQGVSTSQRHEMRPVRFGHTGEREQLTALGRVERVKAVDGDDTPPPSVCPPRGHRRVTTREHHDALSRERREEILPQPRVEGTQFLVAVDQQHRIREISVANCARESIR
jgi:hypothetical protein